MTAGHTEISIGRLKTKSRDKRTERQKNTCLVYCSKLSIFIPLSFSQAPQIQNLMHKTLFIGKVIQTQRGPDMRVPVYQEKKGN